MEVLAGCPGRSQTQPRPDLQALSSAATPFSWSDCVRVQAAASGYHCPAWARVRGTQHPGKTASTRRESAATLTPPPDFVSRRQRMGGRLVGYGWFGGVPARSDLPLPAVRSANYTATHTGSCHGLANIPATTTTRSGSLPHRILD